MGNGSGVCNKNFLKYCSKSVVKDCDAKFLVCVPSPSSKRVND